MNVRLVVTMEIEPSIDEMRSAIAQYPFDPDRAEPDEAWIMEEVAAQRIMKVEGVTDVTPI